MKTTLDKMKINQKGTVVKIKDNSQMKRRFLDIGLTDGTNVECVLVSYGNEMKAYSIKGAIIGIRKEDANTIEIEDTIGVENTIEIANTIEVESTIEIEDIKEKSIEN